MNKEGVFWLCVTTAALVSIFVLLGISDGVEEQLFSSADEVHPAAEACLGGHGSIADHYHVDVAITLLGESYEVPEDVGINDGDCSMRQLHTHDASGRIHVETLESGTQVPLGAFFDIWGLHFDESGFGDYRIDADHEFLMYLNGELVESYDQLILEDKQQVELIYRATD
ncbi:MAG: hypothetical protein L7S56_07460 [Candidatus Poseidonia sp.]|nr:hypothetical protein [Poseidonia sp.]